MSGYESLLLGAGGKKKGGMTYEARLKNLEKARAVRKANLERDKGDGIHTYEKKKTALITARKAKAKKLAVKKAKADGSYVCGEGQWNQDYVDESQINYGGSPLDMYYMGSEKDIEEERSKRGEIGKGMKKVKKSKKIDIDDDEIIDFQVGGDMSFMRNSNHSGMDMPTEAQFQKGGKMAKKSKGGAMEGEINVPDAIKALAMLASKFGLKLSK